MGLRTQYCSDVNSPKLIYTFNAIPIKNSAVCFIETDKLILRFIWKHIAKTTKKKNEIGGLTLSSRLHNSSVTKTVRYSGAESNRSVKWNRESRNRPHIYEQQIF